MRRVKRAADFVERACQASRAARQTAQSWQTWWCGLPPTPCQALLRRSSHAKVKWDPGFDGRGRDIDP
eukprot:5797303-Heterocapsa_arctica.AAC.1